MHWNKQAKQDSNEARTIVGYSFCNGSGTKGDAPSSAARDERTQAQPGERREQANKAMQDKRGAHIKEDRQGKAAARQDTN